MQSIEIAPKNYIPTINIHEYYFLVQIKFESDKDFTNSYENV